MIEPTAFWAMNAFIPRLLQIPKSNKSSVLLTTHINIYKEPHLKIMRSGLANNGSVRSYSAANNVTAFSFTIQVNGGPKTNK